MKKYVCINDACQSCKGTGITASGNICTWSVTPYERHSELNHAPMSRYSPNSVDIIEECDCGMRFLHNPTFGYPITLQSPIKYF